MPRLFGSGAGGRRGSQRLDEQRVRTRKGDPLEGSRERLVRVHPTACHLVGPPHQPDPLETFPERFNATASLFGTRLITDDEGSVHHCVPTMQGKVYRGFAEHDPSASLPMVEEFTKLLERCAVKPLVEVHPGTVHGYAFPGRSRLPSGRCGTVVGTDICDVRAPDCCQSTRGRSQPGDGVNATTDRRKKCVTKRRSVIDWYPMRSGGNRP